MDTAALTLTRHPPRDAEPMLVIRIANAVRLEFATDSLVQSNLSGAAFTGDWLWVAGDEACGLDRLRRLGPSERELLRFGEVRDFPLADLLDLPGMAEEEADLEGMAVADGFLWVVGSHGLKRKNIKPDRDHAENAKRLAKVALDGHLACLPIESDVRGEPCLVRQAQDGRRALRLEGRHPDERSHPCSTERSASSSRRQHGPCWRPIARRFVSRLR